ncbi:hypothetical protein B9Z55_003971 [Caenorhabditis nigoni]|uniref:Uncharacterized protein n=1 Tax=Caenorhabditis nigoni TaxID=1611254 RepID=A0A2G5UV99_9PELO|nr:hypothetical protein B9Z55_003971 [Caenorhabditis nigoni]
MESAVSAVFRSLGSAHRLQPSNASPSSMSQSTSRVLVSDANPLDDVPMEDISGPVVPAVVAPVKGVFFQNFFCDQKSISKTRDH